MQSEISNILWNWFGRSVPDFLKLSVAMKLKHKKLLSIFKLSIWCVKRANLVTVHFDSLNGVWKRNLYLLPSWPTNMLVWSTMNHSRPVNIHFPINSIFCKLRLGDYGIFPMNWANIYRSMPDLSIALIYVSMSTCHEPEFGLPSSLMICFV